MRQIWITRTGSPSVLQVKAAPDPKPAPGEVVIQVMAAGLNFADLLARQGLYPDAPKLPCVVGYEVAGRIAALGPGVDKAWLGQEVLALTRFGGHASQVAVSLKQVFKKPALLSFEQAAALAVNYLTAYQLVVAMGGLKSGESLLVHNAGGGVGLAALDFAKRVGATAYGTASPGKHSFLKERGYAKLFDYREGDWAAEILAATGGRGVDLVLDPVGGAQWKKSYQVLGPAGRLGAYGVSSVKPSAAGALAFLPLVIQMPWFNFVGLMNANKGVFGVNLGRLWDASHKVNEWMAEILKGVEEGWIHPRVDKVFAFEDAALAHQYLEERRNIGKVVLKP
ncbi:MAG TPA: zinc-binding dehydrogenase [bacterium]|nr:zinc-binding dehydrogenase [bacterium]